MKLCYILLCILCSFSVTSSFLLKVGEPSNAMGLCVCVCICTRAELFHESEDVPFAQVQVLLFKK